MQVTVEWQMTDGRHCKTETTRDALRSFFRRRREEISWLTADICLTRWKYVKGAGWSKQSLFRYVPHRPDLWRVG